MAVLVKGEQETVMPNDTRARMIEATVGTGNGMTQAQAAGQHVFPACALRLAGQIPEKQQVDAVGRGQVGGA